MYFLGQNCQDSLRLSVFKQLWDGEGQDQDEAAVGADPESGGGGGCVLYEGAGEMERSYQAAVLSDDSPLRKTGIRDVVLRDDERLSVAVMQPLLLVNSSCVAPPRKGQQLDKNQMTQIRPDFIDRFSEGIFQ